jgi:hypothetical protein
MKVLAVITAIALSVLIFSLRVESKPTLVVNDKTSSPRRHSMYLLSSCCFKNSTTMGYPK